MPAVSDQHLVVVESGHGDIESHDGAHRRRAHRRPGQLALTAPNRPARLILNAEVPVTVLHVHLPVGLMVESAERLWRRPVSIGSLPDTLAAEDQAVGAVVRALARAAEYELDETYAETAAAFLAAHLLARLAGIGLPRHPGSDDRRVASAMAYLHEHYESQVRISDLAAGAGLSQYHFIRLFHRTTGESPYRYLTRLRVARARWRLEASTATVAEIAYACGFPSPSALAAAFRREVGVTPHEYRVAREG